MEYHKHMRRHFLQVVEYIEDYKGNLKRVKDIDWKKERKKKKRKKKISH